MAKSKTDVNKILSFVIIGISVLTFVFFFLAMFKGSWGTKVSFFKFFEIGKTIEVIFVAIGVVIVFWDIIDNILLICYPQWQTLNKFRGFLQLLTAIAMIGIMIYFILTFSKYIAYGVIVLLILAIIQGVIKLLVAKDAIFKK